MPRIRFDFGTLALEAELLDTPTAKAIAAQLPYEAPAMTWGEEVYFNVPLRAAACGARGRRAGGGDAGRDRLLAGGAVYRHRLRPHADLAGQRVPAREPVQHLCEGDVRREGAGQGAGGNEDQD